jgi:hypothetical protein
VWCDGSDFSVFDGNIHDGVAVILCIQNVAAGEHEIVLEWARRKGSVPAFLGRERGSAEYASENERCNMAGGPNKR